jgi:hypothetical protein
MALLTKKSGHHFSHVVDAGELAFLQKVSLIVLIKQVFGPKVTLKLAS